MMIPEVVAIETQSYCNGNCIICPYDKVKIKHGRMPMSMIKRIIDECHDDDVKQISLYGNNEPLMDDRLIDIIGYACKKSYIGLSSNGSVMTPELAKAIAEKVDAINISVHCTTMGDHEKYMPGVSHEKVMQNIRMLNDARIQLHEHATPKLKHLWEKGPVNEWGGNIDALQKWGYLQPGFAEELKAVYEIRCRYLHSASIDSPEEDSRRCVAAASALLTEFIGFPERLFQIGSEIECLNTDDPLFDVFYKPTLSENAAGDGTG